MNNLKYPLDAEYIVKNKRKLKRLLSEQLQSPVGVRIAVLGGSTTEPIVDILELFLLQYNIKPEFYQSGYDKFWSDAVFKNEKLDEFNPEIVWFHTTSRNITKYPEFNDSEQSVNDLLTETFFHYKQAWEAVKKKYGCVVIQNNFEMLFYRILGNRDSYDYRGRNRFIERINDLIYKYAGEHSGFYINDLNYISAAYGLEKWHNLRMWYSYKLAMDVDAIPSFAFNLSNIIKAIYGKNKKFISVDLDNTLWGGVIGDDGVGNIEIGCETAEGEAYLEFQRYLFLLRSMGVILTVNSKNYEENAKIGLNHPEGALKPDAFSVIKANWKPKNENLREIADILNLGIDSAVFLDDNKFERSIISESYPGVAVPEFESVISGISVIDRNGYFEALALSDDDFHRADNYRENAERLELQSKCPDYREFLQSLKMKAEINDFSDLYISRIAQLTNKTNQFNLTTKRYTQTELDTVVGNRDYLCIYGSLEDRFGSNGIVAVSVGHLTDNTMVIDLWLMSCRVLERGMEYAMMDEFVHRASLMGAKTIRGIYIPTKKNNLVKNFYKDVGFRLVEKSDSADVWEIEIAVYENKNVYITVNEDKNNE